MIKFERYLQKQEEPQSAKSFPKRPTKTIKQNISYSAPAK